MRRKGKYIKETVFEQFLCSKGLKVKVIFALIKIQAEFSLTLTKNC